MRFTRAAAELLYRRGRHVSKNYREIFARRGERPRVLLLTEFSASPCGLREIHGGYTRQSRCERTNFPNILAPPLLRAEAGVCKGTPYCAHAIVYRLIFPSPTGFTPSISFLTREEGVDEESIPQPNSSCSFQQIIAESRVIAHGS